DRTFAISVKGINGMTLKLVGAETIATSADNPVVSVRPDRLQSFRLVLNAPPGVMKSDSEDIYFLLEDINTESIATYDSIFRGPKQ
ncbi:MAG: hypothetical protein HON65_13970, partial [Rhodospirillales bacterium]|nr:hypothetical protein [Rhodospirillales bacterium]